MKKASPLVACIMAVVLAAGCVNVANLITLGTQIAVNIIQIIGAFQGQADTADIAVAQSVGQEVSKDWALVTAAYNQYESAKTASNLQNVVTVGSIVESDLAITLTNAHIKDAALAGRIEAGASIIITTIDTIAADLGATIPVAPSTAAFKAAHASVLVGGVKAQRDSIKSLWNASACAPTGNAVVDLALAKARL